MLQETFAVIGIVTVIVLALLFVIYAGTSLIGFVRDVSQWHYHRERGERADAKHIETKRVLGQEIELLQRRICDLEAELVVYRNGGPYRVAGSTSPIESLPEDLGTETPEQTSSRRNRYTA